MKRLSEEADPRAISFGLARLPLVLSAHHETTTLPALNHALFL